MPRGQKLKKEPEPVALKDEVREALLTILREEGAPATARASAARTLMEFFESEKPLDVRPADALTEEELNREIARLQGQ